MKEQLLFANKRKMFIGKRFLLARFQRIRNSPARKVLRLNEGKYAHHRLRPFGLEARTFGYRQFFQKRHASRQGNRRVKRMVKKTARQQAKHQLRKDQEEMRFP